MLGDSLSHVMIQAEEGGEKNFLSLMHFFAPFTE